MGEQEKIGFNSILSLIFSLKVFFLVFFFLIIISKVFMFVDSNLISLALTVVGAAVPISIGLNTDFVWELVI